MKLLDIIKSKVDKTIKYIFLLDDNLITEMSYIDNGTDKDIICVSTQTACVMGCKFCHTMDYKSQLKTRNIKSYEILEGIRYVANDKDLWPNKRMLLISYIGCGEPLLNIQEVFDSMYTLQGSFKSIRFALATMIPKNEWANFYWLTKDIHSYIKVPVKLHLSLHFPFDEIRREWLPNALDILPSLDAIKFYRHLTNNPIELHYTPINGVNNRPQDIEALCNLLINSVIPIKFLKFNEKDSLKARSGSIYTRDFDTLGLPYEFYTPPCLDIGASCGQFLFDYYVKYNKKEG
jgi:23S rRNA (adenine2503-C2)-methyltransferase